MGKVTYLICCAGWLLTLFCSCGHRSGVPAIEPGDSARQAHASQWNRSHIYTAIGLLRSGNIVLRSGMGPDSYILSQLNQKDKTYSHCGIVMVENGYPFVYHSIGGEDNPGERLRRDSAQLFFSPRFNSGIAIVQYNLNDSNIAALSKVARAFYELHPLFDMQFDLATDDKLYCAEFVYKALNKAMNDTGYIGTSTALGRRYVGVDDLFINSHACIVWKVAYK